MHLWPIVALGTLGTGIVKLVGRMLAMVLSFVLMVVGALVCVTIIGADVGVPLLLIK